MSKFVETGYLNKKEILKFPHHHVQIAITVSDTGISANSEGKKIVPAGTILGGDGGFLLSDETKKAVVKNTQGGATTTEGAGVDAEGILLDDVDVTYGPKEGAMVLHGFVKLSALPTAPCADAIKALNQIKFIK